MGTIFCTIVFVSYGSRRRDSRPQELCEIVSMALPAFGDCVNSGILIEKHSIRVVAFFLDWLCVRARVLETTTAHSMCRRDNLKFINQIRKLQVGIVVETVVINPQELVQNADLKLPAAPFA